MAFQAPFDPMDYARLQMTAEAQRAEQQQQYMGQIFGALSDVSNIFAEQESIKAKGRAYKKALDVVGPAMGINSSTLKAAFGDIKSDEDYYNIGQVLFPMAPAMINSRLSQQKIQVQQAAPAARAQYNAASQVAAGQSRMTAPPSNINFDAVP